VIAIDPRSQGLSTKTPEGDTPDAPRGRIRIVEKAGHAVFIDQPEHFDSILDAFMQDLSAVHSLEK
jgi:hypothetical protein